MKLKTFVATNVTIGVLTLSALNYFFLMEDQEPKNRAHYVEQFFSDKKDPIKYNPKEDNFTVLGKWKINYEDRNNLINIAGHYFQKKVEENYYVFDAKKQKSDLETTCKMIDSNKDWNLSNDEISKELSKINAGKTTINLSK